MRLTGWLSALALTVLAGTAPAQTPARVFRLATSVDAATLDPHANNALYTYLLLQQIYEPLTHRADNQVVIRTVVVD